VSQTTASELEQALRALVHKDEIRDVIHRYCRAVDRCDLALMLSCYHPDARDHHGFFTGNAHDFCRYVIPVLEQAISTTHSISNILIELEGERAFSECYWRVTHRLARPDGSLVDNNSRGRYLDVFERRSGEWKIQHRHVVLDSMSDDPVTILNPEGFLELLPRLVPGQRGEGDPVYRRFDIPELAKDDFAMQDFWKAVLGS
jgi:ketosteroid isomerase-like protein